MSVRTATAADLPVLEELWRAFTVEVPPPDHEPLDEATELAEIRGIVEAGLGWVAEKDGAAVGNDFWICVSAIRCFSPGPSRSLLVLIE